MVYFLSYNLVVWKIARSRFEFYLFQRNSIMLLKINLVIYIYIYLYIYIYIYIHAKFVINPIHFSSSYLDAMLFISSNRMQNCYISKVFGCYKIADLTAVNASYFHIIPSKELYLRV